MMRLNSTLNTLLVVIGIWTVLSPFVLAYSWVQLALWNSILIGLAVISLAAGAVLINNPLWKRGLSWLNAVVGFWLMLAPFMLVFAEVGVAFWNCLIVGLIVFGLSTMAAVGADRPASQT